MIVVKPRDLTPGDVIRVYSTKRGLGRKAVVTNMQDRGESFAVIYLLVRSDGKHRSLDNIFGETYFSKHGAVQVVGKWQGTSIKKGARGDVVDEEGNPIQGEGLMATTTRSKSATKKSGAKKAGTKKSGSTSAKKNGGQSKRASEEELDRLAAKVVSLRDDKGESWGDIEEELGVAPSRLRALYNRGGGKPSGKRPGAKSSGKKGSAKGKGKAASKRNRKKAADPSDED